MALVTQSASITASRGRRLWRAPTSKLAWIWLLFALFLAGALYLLYAEFYHLQPFSGKLKDPLYTGLLAYALVLGATAYTLRRRFLRQLPGKTQNWLWAHIWLGMGALAIAFLHERYIGILHTYCQNLTCLTRPNWGPAALYALILLILIGVVGRLLDRWQAHVIARDADRNGVGITRALKERLLEMEYTIERLCAGKSEPFQQYCLHALDHARALSSARPALQPMEEADFTRAQETLTTYRSLVRSLRRQEHARSLMRLWRYIHMILAPLALLVISYHVVLELLTSIFHVVK